MTSGKRLTTVFDCARPGTRSRLGLFSQRSICPVAAIALFTLMIKTAGSSTRMLKGTHRILTMQNQLKYIVESFDRLSKGLTSITGSSWVAILLFFKRTRASLGEALSCRSDRFIGYIDTRYTIKCVTRTKRRASVWKQISEAVGRRGLTAL